MHLHLQQIHSILYREDLCLEEPQRFMYLIKLSAFLIIQPLHLLKISSLMTERKLLNFKQTL